MQKVWILETYWGCKIMSRGPNLTLDKKVQILLRIRLKIPDLEIAKEFGISRSRVTQIRLYELEKIETEYMKKNSTSQLLKMLDKLVAEENEEIA